MDIESTFKIISENEKVLNELHKEEESAEKDFIDIDVGTICPHIHKNAPKGWLACNGK